MQTVSKSRFLQTLYHQSFLYFPGDNNSSSLANFSPSHLQVVNSAQAEWTLTRPEQSDAEAASIQDTISHDRF